jgi:hypothetical protein
LTDEAAQRARVQQQRHVCVLLPMGDRCRLWLCSLAVSLACNQALCSQWGRVWPPRSRRNVCGWGGVRNRWWGRLMHVVQGVSGMVT